MSEVAFHLMHYPLSLVETQWSAAKGAGKALLARQGLGESEDLQYFARYGGASVLLSLVSVLSNTNLFNIFENETQERLTRIVDDLTEYDNPDRGTFGLLSEFTGPTIGTLKYLAIAGGIIDVDNNTLNKILYGNVDFADKDDKYSELYTAYQWSTAWGVYKNKVQPAIQAGRGRDLITHYLKLYPTKTTKKYHEKIFGKPPKKQKKTKDQALAVLESMLRGQ